MLEDRTSARTNAGENSNEFDPATIPSSEAFASTLVGNLSLESWTNGGNTTVDQEMTALQVRQAEKKP